MFTYHAPAVEILTIGDELTRGEIVDTNAAWLAERATSLGLHVRWTTSVTDETEDILAALRQAAARARAVLCSGGLGPTEDDRTVDVACALAGCAAVEDEDHRRRLEERFARLGRPLSPIASRQVRLPAAAEPLSNRVGLAPGFRLSIAGSDLFFMPGVPAEQRDIFSREVAPRLARLGDGAATERRTWRVFGLGEGQAAARLVGLLDGTAGATLHYRLAYPETLVTVVVRRAAREEALALLARLDGEVRARLGGAVVGDGERALAHAVGERLAARGETLATAESCSGGLVGDLLTDVPGSSAYYLGGVIAYANEAKRALLGVRAETLAAHGAVSRECVVEMAEGARARLGATWGIAVSGVAGPGGGTAEKPVGHVHLAVAGPAGVEARVLSWPGERRQVKLLAATAALDLLDRQLEPSRRDAPWPGPSDDRSRR